MLGYTRHRGQGSSALVHGWLSRIKAPKNCFFVLPELGALSHYDLPIGKKKG